MKTNTALYIGADPFNYNDLDIVKKSLKMTDFLYILLDRKNRDAEYSQYNLSYADRSDIIKHDLKSNNISNYKIIPIDTTIQKTVLDNNIDNFILNFDYQKNINFKMFNILNKICKNINIILLKGDNFIDNHCMKSILDFDQTMTLYKDYCSEYAYSIFKIKNTKKYGLTGNFGGNVEIVVDIAKDHGYMVLDIDEYVVHLLNDQSFISNVLSEMKQKNISYYKMFSAKKKLSCIDKYYIVKCCLEDDDIYKLFEKYIYQYINKQIAKCLIENYEDAVVIKFTLLYEFAMEKMFDNILCIETSEQVQKSNLQKKGYSDSFVSDIIQIQQSSQEKANYADYVIKGDDINGLKTNTVKFINTFRKNLCA